MLRWFLPKTAQNRVRTTCVGLGTFDDFFGCQNSLMLSPPRQKQQTGCEERLQSWGRPYLARSSCFLMSVQPAIVSPRLPYCASKDSEVGSTSPRTYFPVRLVVVARARVSRIGVGGRVSDGLNFRRSRKIDSARWGTYLVLSSLKNGPTEVLFSSVIFFPNPHPSSLKQRHCIYYG